MADRRRINGPLGGTVPPVYTEAASFTSRKRGPDDIRAVYLKNGVAPAVSGSAYLEVDSQDQLSGMKLTCTVHGPRALPRSAPFSPHMVLSTHVKYAPFATKHRRGYLRDTSERDLSTHLETALRGVIVADRWPKSGVDVIVTIVEGEQARHTAVESGNEEWDMLNVLSSCVTVAAAAIADAGIDCVDTVTGGVAALVSDGLDTEPRFVLDPVSAEHAKVLAACCVVYLSSRNEITNLWVKGSVPRGSNTALISHAVRASQGASSALLRTLDEMVTMN